jgi:transcriptional regulator with XRE-family HTH domain
MPRVTTPHDDRVSHSQTFPRIVSIVTGVGITQAQLGEAVGSSLRTVQNWAKGDSTPTGTKVQRLLDLSFLIEELQTAYTDEGIQIWMNSRNRNLAGNRPIDLLTQGRIDEVLEEAQRISGAM